MSRRNDIDDRDVAHHPYETDQTEAQRARAAAALRRQQAAAARDGSKRSRADRAGRSRK